MRRPPALNVAVMPRLAVPIGLGILPKLVIVFPVCRFRGVPVSRLTAISTVLYYAIERGREELTLPAALLVNARPHDAGHEMTVAIWRREVCDLKNARCRD